VKSKQSDRLVGIGNGRELKGREGKGSEAFEQHLQMKLNSHFGQCEGVNGNNSVAMQLLASQRHFHEGQRGRENVDVVPSKLPFM